MLVTGFGLFYSAGENLLTGGIGFVFLLGGAVMLIVIFFLWIFRATKR